MTAAAVQRARHWFWALTTIAVFAAGALDQGLHAAPGPGTVMLVLVSALVLVASAVQAARIWAVLAGPPRLLRWLRTPGAPRGRRGGMERRRRDDRASPRRRPRSLQA